MNWQAVGEFGIGWIMTDITLKTWRVWRARRAARVAATKQAVLDYKVSDTVSHEPIGVAASDSKLVPCPKCGGAGQLFCDYHKVPEPCPMCDGKKWVHMVTVNFGRPPPALAQNSPSASPDRKSN